MRKYRLTGNTKHYKGNPNWSGWYLGDYIKTIKELPPPLEPLKCTTDNIKGVITPHAGLNFSGDIAKVIYEKALLNHYERILLLCTDHHRTGRTIIPTFTTATVSTEKSHKIDIDKEWINKLKNNEIITSGFDEFMNEHSFEMQLVFLLYFLKSQTKLIPIIIGSEDLSILNRVADILFPLASDSGTLIIATTDFLHKEPHYDIDFHKTNQTTLTNILTNNIEEILDTPNRNLCGKYATALMMILMDRLKCIPKGCSYSWSSIRDKDTKKQPQKIVGYNTITYIGTEQPGGNPITPTMIPRITLILLARHKDDKNDFIGNSTMDKLKLIRDDLLSLTKNMTKDDNPTLGKKGVFVTFEHNKKLQGCLGRFHDTVNDKKSNLYSMTQIELIAFITIETIFEDLRFEDNDFRHPNNYTISNILNPKYNFKLNLLEKNITYGQGLIDDFWKNYIPCKHGIVLKYIKGNNSATFLPSVMMEQKWLKNCDPMSLQNKELRDYFEQATFNSLLNKMHVFEPWNNVIKEPDKTYEIQLYLSDEKSDSDLLRTMKDLIA